MSGPSIPLVVLAAGAATRFGTDKLLAPLDGRPLLAATLARAARAVDPSQTFVAIGPDQRRREVVAKVALAEVVTVPDAHRGMRWTLQAALAALPGEAPGVLVALADDPLALDSLGAVLEAAQAAPDVPVAMRRDPFLPHPVYLPRATWPAPPTSDDDSGLRDLLGAATTTWVDDPATRPVDVDVPDDLPRLRAVLRQRAVEQRPRR